MMLIILWNDIITFVNLILGNASNKKMMGNIITLIKTKKI